MGPLGSAILRFTTAFDCEYAMALAPIVATETARLRYIQGRMYVNERPPNGEVTRDLQPASVIANVRVHKR
jgi:hypothetical protein